MQVEYSRFIDQDLEEIAAYIAHHNPNHAVTFVAELRSAIAQIGDNPLIYRLRSEVAPDMREAVFGRYVILFRIHQGKVQVQRVLNGARDLRTQMRRTF